MNQKPEKKIVTAQKAKKDAKIFYYGNIAAGLAPFPLFILWFGASVFVYAMYRHHPNKRVGVHTQKAAYYYYILAGIMIPVLALFSGDFLLRYWWAVWAGCAAIMITPAVIELSKINKEQWEDIEYE